MDLLWRLINHEFIPFPLRHKHIESPKPRDLHVPGIEDKLVQHLICDEYATEALTRPLTPAATANRIGYGNDKGIERIEMLLHEFWRKYHKMPVVYKGDIHSFFASILHERAKQLIDKYILDTDVKWLMKMYVDLCEEGLALGLQQNQLLANLYLSEFDHYVMDRFGFHYYTRHMDDFVIMVEKEEDLHEFLEWEPEYLDSIGLELNPKSRICYDNFDFLGFNFRLTDSGKVIRRYAQKKRTGKNGHLRLMAEEYGRGEYSGEQLAVKYFCWRVHASKGNTRNMVEATDRKFNKMLEPYGLQLKIVHCDRGKIHWRVVPVYLKEGDNGTDHISAC